MALAIIVARLMGHVFRRFGQPPVVGEIVGGLLLGKTLLGDAGTDFLFPEEIRPYLQVLAAVGLVLFMFVVGLELDAKLLRGPAAMIVDHGVGIVDHRFPFGLSVAAGVLPF